MTPDKSRRAMFAACSALGMDEGDRKAMMIAVTGKDSSSKFNALDWAKVLDHLNRLTARPDAGKPTRWREGCEAMGGKIAALLAAQKLPWRYLTHGAIDPKTGKPKPSMVKRLTSDKAAGKVGVDRLEFADAEGLGKIIHALIKRAERAGQ